MHGEVPTRYSKRRKVLHRSLASCTALAFVGLVVGGSTGDDAPPYAESLLGDVTLTLFLCFGTATIVLGLIALVLAARDASRTP